MVEVAQRKYRQCKKRVPLLARCTDRSLQPIKKGGLGYLRSITACSSDRTGAGAATFCCWAYVCALPAYPESRRHGTGR
jgi:hypothetical protein